LTIVTPKPNADTGPVVRSDATRLRTLWAAGRPAFGAWSILADPVVAEILAAGEADYVCLDTQHGHVTEVDLSTVLQAYRAGGRAPIVRANWNQPSAIFRVLDTGASGVVVPMVDDADAARAAARATRYPPVGERSWGPMWGDCRPVAPPAEQDRDAMCIVMIETAAGYANIDQIVATPGVDAIYVGPNDLALSCGLGRSTYRDSSEIADLLRSILKTCRDRDLAVGLHCSDAAMATDWASEGFMMLTAVADTKAVRSGIANDLARARSGLAAI
jgi:4-hydroxy-2-oxoheptanedioate aldolase